MQAGKPHELHPACQKCTMEHMLTSASRSWSVTCRGIRHQRLLVKSAAAVDQVSLSRRSKLRVQTCTISNIWAKSALCTQFAAGRQSSCIPTLTDMQKTSDTKFADYQPHVAFFFPGQGAQAVGMAKVCPPCQLLGIFCLCTGVCAAHKPVRILCRMS